jgi:uncharacterized protein (TIGR02118 family)
MVRLIALFNAPADSAAFDAHYRDVHLPIVRRYPNLREVRETRLQGVGGRPPPFYLMTEMIFDTDADLAEALSSDPGAESARDLRNFAGAGVSLFIAPDASAEADA